MAHLVNCQQSSDIPTRAYVIRSSISLSVSDEIFKYLRSYLINNSPTYPGCSFGHLITFVHITYWVNLSDSAEESLHIAVRFICVGLNCDVFSDCTHPAVMPNSVLYTVCSSV